MSIFYPHPHNPLIVSYTLQRSLLSTHTSVNRKANKNVSRIRSSNPLSASQNRERNRIPFPHHCSLSPHHHQNSLITVQFLVLHSGFHSTKIPFFFLFVFLFHLISHHLYLIPPIQPQNGSRSFFSRQWHSPQPHA